MDHRLWVLENERRENTIIIPGQDELKNMMETTLKKNYGNTNTIKLGEDTFLIGLKNHLEKVSHAK